MIIAAISLTCYRRMSVWLVIVRKFEKARHYLFMPLNAMINFLVLLSFLTIVFCCYYWLLNQLVFWRIAWGDEEADIDWWRNILWVCKNGRKIVYDHVQIWTWSIGIHLPMGKKIGHFLFWSGKDFSNIIIHKWCDKFKVLIPIYSC